MKCTKKQVFIAGGSHAEIPLVTTAKDMGFDVITSGSDANGKAHSFSDRSIICDYSNSYLLKEAFKSSNADYLIPGANDFSLLTCASIALEFNLPGYDPLSISQLIHHKNKWREFCSLHHIKTPSSMTLHRNADISKVDFLLKFPVMVKPIDLSGGKGISKVYSLNELNSRINIAFNQSRENFLVIEEFIEGSNHGASIFIKNKSIEFIFIDNEYYYKNPFLVAGASSMTSCTDSVTLKIRQQCEKITNLLNLKNGLIHIQFIIDPDKNPVIIEICRRLPGDLYPDLVKFSTGYPYCEKYIENYIGVTSSGVLPTLYKKNITRHCVMAETNGLLKDIHFESSDEDIMFNWMQLKEFNFEIKNYLSDKIGIAFFEHTYSSLNRYPIHINNRIVPELIKI